MFKIEKSIKSISFMWEKDEEPGSFEHLQDNKDFVEVINRVVTPNLTNRIGSTRIIIKIDCINSANQNTFIEYTRIIKDIFDDFFDIFKYGPVKDNINYSEINKCRLSTCEEINDIDKSRLYLDENNNLYYLDKDVTGYKIDTLIKASQCTIIENIVIVSSKQVKIDIFSLTSVSSKLIETFTSLEELYAAIGIDDTIDFSIKE